MNTRRSDAILTHSGLGVTRVSGGWALEACRGRWMRFKHVYDLDAMLRCGIAKSSLRAWDYIVGEFCELTIQRPQRTGRASKEK